MEVISCEDFTRQVEAESLKSGSVLGATSSEAVDFLLHRARLYRLLEGDLLFNYGDKGGSFFIIAKGNIDYFKHHNGKFWHTRSVGFGEELGFVSMIALHDRVGYAIAREDCLLVEIDSATFSELHDQYPFDFGVLTLNLAREMARTIRKVSNALVEVSAS